MPAAAENPMLWSATWRERSGWNGRQVEAPTARDAALAVLDHDPSIRRLQILPCTDAVLCPCRLRWTLHEERNAS